MFYLVCILTIFKYMFLEFFMWCEPVLDFIQGHARNTQKGMVSQDQICKMVLKLFILLKYNIIVGVLYDSGTVSRWELLLILFSEYSPYWYEDNKNSVSTWLICISCLVIWCKRKYETWVIVINVLSTLNSFPK